MNLRRFGVSLSLSLVLALGTLGLGCGSSASEAPLTDDPVTAAAKNPDGVAYPTDHIGTRARTRLRVGDRLANFAFRGYVAGNPDGGLVTVSMADFFDPEAKKHRVLHIQGVASWCPICAGEAKDTKATAAQLVAEGAVIVQVLFQGRTRNVGPSLLELDTWCDTYDTAHPVLFDTNAQKLGVFGIDGFPWNALIDTRTMEILDQGTGAPSDVAAYVREGLRVATGPVGTWE